MQISQPRRIYQIKLGFPKQYAPYKYMTPYILLERLNKQCKSKYDIQIVHIKYLMSNISDNIAKNRQQKYLQSSNFINDENLPISRQFNNIFAISDKNEKYRSMIQFIFNKAQKLKPPLDFNPDDEQKMRENELKNVQMKRLLEIKDKINDIMQVYHEKNHKVATSVTAMTTLKSTLDPSFVNNEHEIYVYAAMTQFVFQKLRQDSRQKNKTLIEFKYKQKIMKTYINPTYQQPAAASRLTTEYRIMHWDLNTHYQQNLYYYFGTQDLQHKIKKINQYVQLISSVSFNCHEEIGECIDIMSLLWNQIVVKLVVRVEWITRIEKIEGERYCEYYFYLRYPPLYYVNVLKKDQAASENYMKFYDRVGNFVFLENQYIKNDYFLRYFLLNNSILRIVIDLQSSRQPLGSYIFQRETRQQLQIFSNKLSETIEYRILTDPYTKKYNIRQLITLIDYRSFEKLNKLTKTKQYQDKIWLIKYLVLVLIRNNFVVPGNKIIGEIVKLIEEEEKENVIDSYLYVLWCVVTRMEGYRNVKESFLQFFHEKSQEIQKMNVKNILKKIFKKSENISYVFPVSLSPSGYLFNPPIHEIKGRLLKQFAQYSQFFIKILFTEENGCELKNQRYIPKIYFRNQLTEIKVLGRAYDPVGWCSQVKPHSLWYFHPIEGRNQDNYEILEPLDRRRILEFLGDFRRIQNPAKKAVIIGKNLCPSLTFKVKNIRYSLMSDINTTDRISLSNGIGQISKNLLQKISLGLHLKNLSVLQICYHGAKGILVLDSQLKKNAINLRESMVKYQCFDERVKQYLDIFDWNRYRVGNLTRQNIVMMRRLGIRDEVFINLQMEYIGNLLKMGFDDRSILKYIEDDGAMELNMAVSPSQIIKNLLASGMELEREIFFKEVLQTVKKHCWNKLRNNGSIAVEKSIKAIGIIDEDQILEEGEIYFPIWNYDDGYSIREVREDTKVVMIRYPCINATDIRVVKCVGEEQIQLRFKQISKCNKFVQLSNVVVMSQKQRYPFSLMMSSSDYENHHLFISWDERLIPNQIPQLNLTIYPTNSQMKSNSQEDNQSSQKLLDFIIDYMCYQKQEQINDSYLIHADKDIINYTNNQQCRRIAKIYYKIFNFVSNGIQPQFSPTLLCNEYPNFMEKCNVKSYQSKSILGKLYQSILSSLNQKYYQNNISNDHNYIDPILILNFKYDYSHRQLIDCIKILKQYEYQLTSFFSLMQVQTQHEVYLNYSNNKTIGKYCIMAEIQQMRQKYLELFFCQFEEDYIKYRNEGKNDQYLQLAEYFSYKIKRKTQIYYLVSYLCKIHEIDWIEDKRIEQLIKQINSCFEELRLAKEQQKFCGFVWFVIPKIIINLRMTNKQQKRQQIQKMEIPGEQVKKENNHSEKEEVNLV